MKKSTAFFLAIVLLFVCSACGSERAVQTEGKATETIIPTSTPDPTPETPKVAYEITYSNFRLYKNSIGTVWGQTIVEFENTGTSDLYLSAGSYDIETADGSLAAAKTLVSEYPSVLKPGERGYMYEETTFEDLEVDSEYTLIPRINAEAAKVDCIEFEITDFQLKNDTFSDLSAVGRVTNTSDEEQSWIYIIAVLKNSEGTPIGILSDIVTETLAPSDKIGFEMSAWMLPDDVTLDSVADCSLFAYPNQFQF